MFTVSQLSLVIIVILACYSLQRSRDQLL